MPNSTVEHRLELSNPVIVIVGPTASGKTDVAQEIARRVNGEVISADSMQIYKGMDIEQASCLNRIDSFRTGGSIFASQVRLVFRVAVSGICAKLSPTSTRVRNAACSRGNGFAVRAAIDDYDFASGEQVNNPIREKWSAFLAEQGSDALWRALQQCDAASAAIIHPTISKRVLRA